VHIIELLSNRTSSHTIHSISLEELILITLALITGIMVEYVWVTLSDTLFGEDILFPP
jgi:hypothetical protein